MFSWFKSTSAEDKLHKKYETKMREARDQQRSGDLKAYAKLIAEADEILKQIESLSTEKGG